MLPIEIDNDYEGSTADISLEEDRLVIDISFEASDNGGLTDDADDADHESEELESPESPDPEVQIGSESRSMTYYDDRNNDDDLRDGDVNNNEENNITEDKDHVDETSEEETEASSEEWDSDSEAIRDSDGGYQFAEFSQDDDSNSEVIGYDDGDDEFEGMSGSEDDVDENSEEEEIEASNEEPIECKVESELNRDSSDEEESEKVGRILTRFFKAARKKAKASPKKNDTSDKDAFDKSSATFAIYEEMLNAKHNELLAARNSLIRRRNRIYELLHDAKLRRKRKRKRKEKAEKQQYNSKHVKRKKQ